MIQNIAIDAENPIGEYCSTIFDDGTTGTSKL